MRFSLLKKKKKKRKSSCCNLDERKGLFRRRVARVRKPRICFATRSYNKRVLRNNDDYTRASGTFLRKLLACCRSEKFSGTIQLRHPGEFYRPHNFARNPFALSLGSRRKTTLPFYLSLLYPFLFFSMSRDSRYSANKPSSCKRNSPKVSFPGTRYVAIL